MHGQNHVKFICEVEMLFSDFPNNITS